MYVERKRSISNSFYCWVVFHYYTASVCRLHTQVICSIDYIIVWSFWGALAKRPLRLYREHSACDRCKRSIFAYLAKMKHQNSKGWLQS